MNRVIILFTICFAFAISLSAQSNEADKLVGTYMLFGNKSKVTIEKRGVEYFGKVIWTHTEGMLDVKNPKEEERSKTLVGKEVLWGVKFSKKGVWDSGKIYDPRSGKTYSCKITLLDNGNIGVRPFIGFSLIGKTLEWKRIE